MSKINEVFAAPVVLHSIGNLNGMNLYTSDKLKDKFLEGFNNSSLSSYMPNLKELIDKETMNPCFGTKSLFEYFIIRNLLRGGMITLAFYSPKLNKIYFLMDNNATALGRIPDEEIGNTTIHEFMHYVAENESTFFIKTFAYELGLYYSTVFNLMFEAKCTTKDGYAIAKFLFDKGEKKATLTFKEIKDMLYKYIKPTSKYTDKEFENVTNHYLNAVYLYLENDYRCLMRPYSFFHACFWQGFKKAFNVNVGTKICYQEAFIPSEVICSIVHAPFIKTKIINSLKTI